MLPILQSNASLPEVIAAINRICEHIRDNETKRNSSGWAGYQTNVTADRAFDANSTSTDELADVLGTLISDLINSDILR